MKTIFFQYVDLKLMKKAFHIAFDALRWVLNLSRFFLCSNQSTVTLKYENTRRIWFHAWRRAHRPALYIWLRDIGAAAAWFTALDFVKGWRCQVVEYYVQVDPFRSLAGAFDLGWGEELDTAHVDLDILHHSFWTLPTLPTLPLFRV